MLIAGIGANLLRPAAQHLFIQKIDQLFHFRRARFPLDADVNVFSILAVDDQIHALGMQHRSRHAGEVAHRAHAGVEVQNLPKSHVERTDTAAYRSGERALDGDPKVARRVHGILRQPFLEFVVSLFPREHFEPCHLALAAIGVLDGGVEYALRRLPDIAAGAVAFDVRNDGTVGNAELPAGVFDRLAIARNRLRVVRRFHEPHLVCFDP